MALQIGDLAPDFEAETTEGRRPATQTAKWLRPCQSASASREPS
jgi:hypothetical protein